MVSIANRIRVEATVPISGTKVLMPGAYSTDLRERVLRAVEAGESPEAVAARFMIGRSSVYRWLAAARPTPMNGGPSRSSAMRPRRRCGGGWTRAIT
jgi:transposase